MAALMHVHYYLQKFMFDVFFSETLTWQQQQHNVATSVIMTTNLNWWPPGARNVRISFVPTVTGTMPDLHQPNNTS
jgi:hypothetical protein